MREHWEVIMQNDTHTHARTKTFTNYSFIALYIVVCLTEQQCLNVTLSVLILNALLRVAWRLAWQKTHCENAILNKNYKTVQAVDLNPPPPPLSFPLSYR